jgi:putative membrane protein
MVGRLSRYGQAYVSLVLFSIGGSLLVRLSSWDPGPIPAVAGAITLVMGFLAAATPIARAIGWRATAVALVGVLALGACAEIVGLYTGLPFGRYVYTDRWAPVVTLPGGHPFPLLLPLAWGMMAACAFLIGSRLANGRWWGPLVGGLVAAAVDLPMEPVMTDVLGYWRWLDSAWPIGGPLPGGAPIMNFVGWLLTTWTAGLLLRRAGADRAREEPDPGYVLGAHLALTLSLGLIARISAPGPAG